MTSILSRLLTADKPWSVPYQVTTPQYQYPDGVTGNDFPTVAKKRKNSRKSQDSSVRFGRVPKREKAKILAAMQKVNACSQEKALCAELEDELRLLTTIVRAHEETCDYTREKVAGLVEKARTQPVYTQCPPQLACPLNPAPHILDNGVSHYMEDFSERFAPAIKGVVEFAKRIPGFGFLSQDDQVTLLKAGVFEVLLVRLACMFDSQANSLICLNGQVLRRESLHSASNARFLLDSMFDFAERLNTIHLMDNEVGLFCAVVIIAADRPGLRNTELVLKIQKKLMDILQKSVAGNHPENPSIFNDLMKKIPDLRTLNTLHSEKLLAYKMEPRNRQLNSAIEGIADTSVTNGHAYSPIHPDIWSHYSFVASHPPLMTPEEDVRSASPGVQSLHGGSTTGSEWSTTDSKDEHDLVGSPRSVGSGLCSDEVKSPIRTSSFSSSRSYVNEEAWVETNQAVMDYHQHLAKRVSENPGSEHGSSSGDEGYFIDSPMKGQAFPKLHRVDSPTDSGIESGKEHGPSTTPTISNCSSPRSSVDEKLKDEQHSPSQEKMDSTDDMPVLKRALQAPPLVNTNMLMDEAYRHHKKFRAARREAESPSSPGQVSLASTHSTLVRTLEQAPRYLSEQQLKRTDLIHNIIMRNETLPNQQSPSLPQHHQNSSQTPSQSHHVDALPATCPSLQNGSYSFSSVPTQTSTQPSVSLATSHPPQQHKSLLMSPNGYYVQYSGNVQPASIYSSSTPVSWPFAQQQPSSSAPTVTSASPVQVHAAQYEHSHLQQNSVASFCASSSVVNTSRAGSPRLLYNPRSPVTSTSLVMNGVGLCSQSSSVCLNDTRPIQSEGLQKPSGESQPLNLSKKLFSPPLLKMES